MNKVLIFLSVLVFMAGNGCTEKVPADTYSEHIKAVQKKYAPDKRVTVFTVKAYHQGSAIVVTGDVEHPAAKEELLTLLASASNKVIDSISILPDKNLGEKRFGIITVSVANMRSEPSEGAELGTQVLMGSIVRILKKKGGWLYIQSPDKYLGWADADQMIRVSEQSADDWNRSKKLFVTDHIGFLLQNPSAESFPVCDVAGGALLKNMGRSGDWMKAGLADGRTGYIKRSSVIDYEDWGKKLVPAAENIERTGRYLLGVPYLWGGTSTKGVDCSGFTKTVFLLNGQSLNRDANQQAEQGEPVDPGKEFEHLTKGDLLFFGRKAESGKPERIVHVGIYLGAKKYIHSSGRVQVNSFDPNDEDFNEYNLKRFVRARRVIPSTPKAAEVSIR